MKKFILVVMLVTINLSAGYLFDTTGECINDYYYKNGKLNYQLSSDSNWYQHLKNTTEISIFSGFEYDVNTLECSKPNIVKYLGLNTQDYNFLIALTALLTGFLTLFFMVYISIEVAKK